VAGRAKGRSASQPAESSGADRDARGRFAPGNGRTFRPGRSGNPGGLPKSYREIRDLARAHAPWAIENLRRLAEHARSESARALASIELLNRGYGRPVPVDDDGQEVRTLQLVLRNRPGEYDPLKDPQVVQGQRVSVRELPSPDPAPLPPQDQMPGFEAVSL
jgi:hypothetical protein